MVVQHNISAINANRYYGINNSKLSKSLEKLSSGYAINRAGDNAAGLAVSEKMRAQIAGINQGVTNAQDGISMVQTFEGALTETDSILQRMKTLATQSANGTYDNDVDRVSIQNEFDQLNDELNQIADTDFNGVIVLNGGVMSDGTKAVDGKFDYANSSRAAKQLSSSDINTVDYQAFDDYNATNGITNADKVWNALNSDWDRKDTAKEDGPESIDITLKYDSSNGNWTVDSASDGANKKNITVGQTANGGFDLTAGGIKFANVILDETSLKNGDTIVLTLNNPKANIAAPTNAGVSDVDKSDLTQGTATGYVKVDDADFTATIATGIKGTDANMTEDINKLLEQLDGATVSAKYVNDAATAAGDMSITLKDGTEIKGSTDGSFTLKDGTQFYATKTTAGEIKLSTTADGTAAVTDIITIAMDTKATKVDGDTTGTMTGKIAIDYNSYSTASKPSVVVKEPTGSNVSISDSYSQATANLTYAADVTLQVGARTKDSVNFTFKYDSTGIGDLEADLNCTAEGLGTASLSLATQEDANAAIDAIGNAINKVSMVRGTFGAIQNRLEHKIDNLNTTSENLTDAESRIRDTDMATEMMNFTKNQILAQASQSMLAQANQLPQGVLSLLQ